MRNLIVLKNQLLGATDLAGEAYLKTTPEILIVVVFG